jgi:hypothetical protein
MIGLNLEIARRLSPVWARATGKRGASRGLRPLPEHGLSRAVMPVAEIGEGENGSIDPVGRLRSSP